MLREDNIRTGFLESKQHNSLAAETGKVGLWLRALFETGYTYGWRHEELLALRVRQVNLVAGTELRALHPVRRGGTATEGIGTTRIQDEG